MVKFRFHGNSSSGAPRNQADARSRLCAIARSAPIVQLVKTLGPEAQLHLVGGAVREAFLSDRKTDLDLTSVFPPEKSEKLLVAAGLRVIETGIKHGTITVLVENNPIEITTFRKPGAAKPEDYSTNIEEDLRGRDFTINAIAFSLHTNSIVDPTGGIADIGAHVLRAVGVAGDRFREDPLRLLRMIRFGPAAGRSIESDTLLAATQLAPIIERVSAERVREEVTRILLSASPGEALRAMLGCKLIDVLFPEMLPSVGFEQNDFHIHDVFEHTIWVLERCPSEKLLRWAAFFHDLGKPRSLSIDADGRRHFYKHEEYSEEIANTIMHRLRFSNDDIDAIRSLVRHHMRPLECGPSGVRRLIRDLDSQFDNWRIFKRADAPPKMSDGEFEEKMKAFDSMYDAEMKRRQASGQSKLAIGGNELIALGLRPGPRLGSVLKRLEELVIENPECNERETLLERAKDIIARDGG